MTQSLGDWVTTLGVNARRAVTDPDSATPVDRVVMAVALVSVAAIIVWPTGKPAPAAVAWVTDIGRKVWLQREQWVPTAPN